MSRREIREQIFRMLFRVDFYAQEDMPEQFHLFAEDMPVDEDEVRPDPSPADLEYIENKIKHFAEVHEDIDAAVNAAAEKWKTTRMGKVELTIIRLAVYEMKYEDDIPVSVAINEAVELAKIYGGEESAGFVNGILAKLA